MSNRTASSWPTHSPFASAAAVPPVLELTERIPRGGLMPAAVTTTRQSLVRKQKLSKQLGGLAHLCLGSSSRH